MPPQSLQGLGAESHTMDVFRHIYELSLWVRPQSHQAWDPVSQHQGETGLEGP